jgi:hypothetical protein
VKATLIRAVLSLHAKPDDAYLDVLPGATNAAAIGAFRTVEHRRGMRPHR